jgi:hydroxyacylglutathione hydrolase
MIPIPLEDLYSDIIAKAQRGLGVTDEALAEKTGLTLRAVQRVKGNQPERALLVKIAGALDLDAESLIALSEDRYRPDVTVPEDGFAMFTTPYGGGMTVNSYMFWRSDARTAVVFDTGSTCSGIIATAKSAGVKIDAIFLTHTHPDHVADLRRLREFSKAPIFVGNEERLTEPKTIGIAAGSSSGAGPLQVKARATPGHSPGGMTYVLEGFPVPFAVVGDALFAGSMGGVAPELYPAALKANRAQILSLPDETILCPGHGPLTTVALEKKHNPFYAGRA